MQIFDSPSITERYFILKPNYFTMVEPADSVFVSSFYILRILESVESFDGIFCNDLHRRLWKYFIFRRLGSKKSDVPSLDESTPLLFLSGFFSVFNVEIVHSSPLHVFHVRIRRLRSCWWSKEAWMLGRRKRLPPGPLTEHDLLRTNTPTI